MITSRQVARRRYRITVRGIEGFRVLVTGDKPQLLLYTGGGDLFGRRDLTRDIARQIMQQARRNRGWTVRREQDG